MRTHEQNRCAVCLICMNKSKEMRRITDNMHDLIQRHCIDGYDKSDDRLPTSICGTCRSALTNLERGKPALLDVFDHSLLGQTTRTRAQVQEGCSCKVCEVASSTINPGPGAMGILKRPRGRPTAETEKYLNTKPKVLKICTACLTVLARGKPHECTKSVRVENMELFASKSSPGLSAKFAAAVVRKRVRSSEDGSAQLTSSTGGKPLNVYVSPPSETMSKTSKRQLFSASDIQTMQQDLNLSTRKTHILGQNIRGAAGPSSIESNLRNKLHEKDHHHEEFFDLKQLTYIQKEKQVIVSKISKDTVVCSDINKFCSRVIDERNIDKNNLLVKIGIDGGGGFMKICMSIFDVEEHARQGRKKFKDSGVKKLFILAIAPSIQENYENAKLMWLSTGLHNFMQKFSVATDLKLANIILGIMAHGSSHPCCWCDIEKSCLKYCGKLRTLGSLKASFWDFFDAGRKREAAKDYGNVVHPCLLQGEEDSSILELVPPPELHLLTGTVNTLYIKMMEAWPEAEKWLRECHVERQGMHGGSFTGNASRTLLKNVDKLAAMVPLKIIPFVSTFRSFNGVVETCFGNELKLGYEAKIQDFKEKYLDLGINVTPKVHAVFHHVQQFCSLTGATLHGLGRWSEQASEAVHYDFSKLWENYKVPEGHPDFGKRLLRAVSVYNSRHQ